MIRAMGSLVRLLAIGASLIVALSLLLFTIDQTSAGSENQVREIDAQTPAQTPPEAVEAPDPSPQAERVPAATASGSSGSCRVCWLCCSMGSAA
jgi:hypothetical protein